MNRHVLIAALSLVAFPGISMADKKAPKSEAKSPPQTSTAAATVGTPGDGWTDTTKKAATSPEQQAQLANGKPFTVTGEVIDVSCYLQLGKRGEAHIPCGTKCLMNNQPIGILDDNGSVYTLLAEQHDPRRDGALDLKATFVPLLAKRVTVSGMLADQGNAKAIFVRGVPTSSPKK